MESGGICAHVCSLTFGLTHDGLATHSEQAGGMTVSRLWKLLPLQDAVKMQEALELVLMRMFFKLPKYVTLTCVTFWVSQASHKLLSKSFSCL